MNLKCKKIVSIFFIIIVFVVGAGTVYNSKSVIKEIFTEHKLLSCKSEIETSVRKNFQFRNNWINLNGLAQRALGVTIVRDPSETVYKLSNGQIMYGLSRRDMKWYAEAVSDLNKELSDMDISFLYVQIPYKIKDDSYMPPGTHANGNANADQLVGLLREKNVDTLDLRREIEKEGFDWPSLFFDTDHHWTPRTGLWASGKIMSAIEKNYGFDIDMKNYDLNNYNSKIYKDWFLGSLARRTGKYYAGVDDIEVLNPKFETDFTVWSKNSEEEEVRTGDFEQTMCRYKFLKDKATFDENTDRVYLGANYHCIIKNKKCNNGLKVLWLKESFSRVLLPFVSNDVEELRGLDLREYKAKSVVEYCKEYKPDLVVIAYNPSAFSKKQFRFF